MARRETAIPLFSDSDDAGWLDQELDMICRNLLERPSDCRGPFIILDRELRTAEGQKPRTRFKLTQAAQ
jgi:hypothetical protein